MDRIRGVAVPSVRTIPTTPVKVSLRLAGAIADMRPTVEAKVWSQAASYILRQAAEEVPRWASGHYHPWSGLEKESEVSDGVEPA